MNKIINYKQKVYLGIEIKSNTEAMVRKKYPNHGCPECHYCDMQKRFICCQDEIAEQIKEKYGGCNGFDNKQNIIFIEVPKE